MWSTFMSKLSRWVPGLSRAQSAQNQANAHGNKVKGLLRLSTLLWSVLLIALVVVIWWLGPSWQVRGMMPLAPLTNRLLATLAVVTVAAIVWGIRLARRLRELDDQRQLEDARQQDPIMSQVERQEASLNRVLSEITDSLGGGC